jgi:hypothetical protein
MFDDTEEGGGATSYKNEEPEAADEDGFPGRGDCGRGRWKKNTRMGLRAPSTHLPRRHR